jgi:hypothetical protein
LRGHCSREHGEGGADKQRVVRSKSRDGRNYSIRIIMSVKVRER